MFHTLTCQMTATPTIHVCWLISWDKMESVESSLGLGYYKLKQEVQLISFGLIGIHLTNALIINQPPLASFGGIRAPPVTSSVSPTDATQMA